MGRHQKTDFNRELLTEAATVETTYGLLSTGGGILIVVHEVDRPTYETVGLLERVDARDNLFAGSRLAPGLAEEQTYHAPHPDSHQIDLRRATFHPTENRQALVCRQHARHGPPATIGPTEPGQGQQRSRRGSGRDKC
ncbi:MAG: hypothetical protein ACE5F6_17290 [Anaerolineae bacterium]